MICLGSPWPYFLFSSFSFSASPFKSNDVCWTFSKWITANISWHCLDSVLIWHYLIDFISHPNLTKLTDAQLVLPFRKLIRALNSRLYLLMSSYQVLYHLVNTAGVKEMTEGWLLLPQHELKWYLFLPKEYQLPFLSLFTNCFSYSSSPCLSEGNLRSEFFPFL